MREFQAIYANVNGWGIQEATEGLPEDAAKTFTDYSTALNRTFSQYKDVFQGTVCALKSDGKYAYWLEAANDGDADRSGRSNVRTHGFIFPLDENPEFYADNRKLLRFSASNFSDRLRTEAPVYDEPYPDIRAVMAMCGLDTERLSKLIRCIYALLLSGADDTLHIRIPNSAAIRPCMLCIYQGIPYSVRREVSFSNVPASDGFVCVTFLTPGFPEINRNIKYFDLLTGAENVLDSETVSELEKHAAFHPFVMDIFDQDEADPDEALDFLLNEFRKEEEALHIPETIGISGRLDMIHLICQMIKFDECPDDMSEKEILLLLMRLLNLQLESDFSGRILTRILHYCERNNLNLNDRVTASMQKKYSMTKNETVKEAIFRYQSGQLLYLDADLCCRKLYGLREENMPLFVKTVACIRESDTSPDHERSAATLDLLYAEYIGRNANARTLEQIKSFYSEIAELNFSPHPRTDAFFRKKMVQAVGSFTEKESQSKAVFTRFWGEWNAFLSALIPDPELRNEIIEDAKAVYWDAFDMALFTPQEIDFYRSMHCDPERSVTWDRVQYTIDLLMVRREDTGLRSYGSAMLHVLRHLKSDAAREHMIGIFLRNAGEIYRNPEDLEGWLRLLPEITEQSVQVKNFYVYVFRYQLAVLYENAEERYMNCTADKAELAEYQRLVKEIAEQDSVSGVRAGELADALRHVSRKKFGGITGFFKKR